METINTQNFDMGKFKEYTAKIMAGSPVHKINFNIENKNSIVGMYLITMQNNMNEYLDNAANYNDLSDTSLLVFESRHVIECCNIIYGCLAILKSVKLYNYKYETFIQSIIDITLSKPIFRREMISAIDALMGIVVKGTSKEQKEIIDKFDYIVKNIWFVPYGKIDEMVEEAINEFKKHNNGDNK